LGDDITRGEKAPGPLKTPVQIIDSMLPAFRAGPLADARGYNSAS